MSTNVSATEIARRAVAICEQNGYPVTFTNVQCQALLIRRAMLPGWSSETTTARVADIDAAIVHLGVTL